MVDGELLLQQALRLALCSHGSCQCLSQTYAEMGREDVGKQRLHFTTCLKGSWADAFAELLKCLLQTHLFTGLGDPRQNAPRESGGGKTWLPFLLAA